MRPNKTSYYLQIAKDVALRSPYSRRRFGVILVKNDVIISTGYNGSARGTLNCGEELKCLKDIHHEKSLLSYEHCPAVHAEVNTLLNAAREGICTIGATLYLNIGNNDGDKTKSDRPCRDCRREVIQAGIVGCFYIDNEGDVCYESISTWKRMENEWMKKESGSNETENHV